MAAPTLPAEAKAADPDGAAAFIRHYFQIANHAYATGDLSAFDHIREDACEACASLEDTVQDAYGPGGRIQGGRIEVGDVVVTPGHSDLGLSAKVVLSQEPGSLLDSDGVETEPVNGAEELLISAIVKFVDHWVMVEWGTAVVPTE